MSDPLDILTTDQADLLEKAAVPEWTDPMLATLVGEPFSDPDWIYERKLDGERCLAFRDGDDVRLRSRNRRPPEGTYPELLDPLRAANSDRFVVDGEVVAFEGDVASFGRLQQRMQLDDPDSKGVHWIDPELVGEVGFTEWTKAARLRHPRFLGLRRDKDASDVVREVPAS